MADHADHCTACGARWKLAVPEQSAPTAISGACPTCKGEGFLGKEPRVECPRCKGRGFVVVRTRKEASHG